MRAECARIQMVLVVVKSNDLAAQLLTGMYEALQHTYPNTPVYMITDMQKRLILYRELLISMGAIKDWTWR